MSLIKWNDHKLLPTMSTRLDDLFDGDFWSNFNKGISMPAVNVHESDLSYTMELAIPGKSKEDFNIEVENGYLIVSSEEEKSDEREEKNYTRKEYSYQSFNRSFKLPENCNPDEIDAWYENGILSITLAKEKMTKPQKRTITVS